MFKLASMVNSSEVLIIGAGLAGLTAAIHLSKAGRSVTVIEKHEFPRHKVCGEYISNEVLPYLESLGVDCGELAPVQISNTCISSINGRQLSGKLPLGGFGVSRFALDKFLYDKAVLSGCRMVHDSVTEISFNSDLFTIGTTKSGQLTSKIAVGAFGKRSNIDQKLSRNFIAQKSPWLAVKAHYKGNIPSDVVTLHNFDGGYCGVSKVENDIVNICYLANYDTFKKYKHIEDYQQHVLFKNPALKAVFENCEMQFDKPLTISQISFCKKPTVENHVLMTGDAAGLIHPLCGNGMAMAIRTNSSIFRKEH